MSSTLKLTKIVHHKNWHTYVAKDTCRGIYGDNSRCVTRAANGRWYVEHREGARFMGRRVYVTAREALRDAKRGGCTCRTITMTHKNRNAA
jgi:cytosine/adenosine deaminase-related metal-dependent hydrolase